MGYVVAAYAIVVGSLAVYGVWLRAQRRAVERELRRQAAPPAGPGSR